MKFKVLFLLNCESSKYIAKLFSLSILIQNYQNKITNAVNQKSCIICSFNISPCADPESFVRGVAKFDNFFLVDEGIEHPNVTINGPSSARQRNAI